ncbi:MAG: plasmid recombination protein [bacterium]|nr:plasmid recombination protein [bacterium]
MASIDFKKLKTAGDVKAMLRHSDMEERLKHEHSNEDINKELTENNVNYTKLTYKQSCERYDKRIKFLDEQPGANLRKDRVTAFGLNVPACEGMTQEESKRFFNDVCKEFQQEFGAKNIISAVAHFDEVHSYVDRGELKESRPHLHFYVIPEIDGKLNGKKFSAKKRMIELNQKIDTLAREKYNKKFLTHEAPRKRSVEELKRLTEDELKEKEDIIEAASAVFKENEHLKKSLESVYKYSQKHKEEKLSDFCQRVLDFDKQQYEKPKSKPVPVKTSIQNDYELEL